MEKDIRPTIEPSQRRLLPRAAQIARRTRIEDQMQSSNLRPSQKTMQTQVGHH